MKRPFYITTPIYFASDNLHVGHTYCTVATDAIARYKRLRGYDVRFLTGTDEHGQKIERLAARAGVEPKEYVDNIAHSIKALWKLMGISNDDFIRTTDERHQKCVQRVFKKLYDSGDIYLGKYKGAYCTPCESFWTATQLVHGNCPDCGRPTEEVEEESYFFRMSKYAPRLIEHINAHPEFIQPASRANEMLQNFLLPGLEDLSVSRTNLKWGIPVDFDPKHVVYVWLDALVNYVSALGYLSGDDAAYQTYWPASAHIVGKEIVRFHTIIWPIMLMALELPLPERVFGHGWLILEGGKMSKSKGNVVDPVTLVNRYGVDAIRYFLLREVAFGQDGLFSNEALLGRVNSDLANDLGNLLSRSVTMIEKYFGSLVPKQGALLPEDEALVAQMSALPDKVAADMDEFRLSGALTGIFAFVSACNKYIDVTAPWILAKSEDTMERLGTVLYNLAEGLRVIAVLLTPFMPDSAARIFGQLGVSKELTTWESAKRFGALLPGTKVNRGEALFPRIDIAKEMESLQQEQSALQEAAKQRQGVQDESAADAADAGKGDATAQNANAAEPPKLDKNASATGIITYDDFAKLELRLAKVLACEPVKRTEKLLKLTLKVGEEERVVVSGIKKWYAPEDLVGKTVVLVYNLEPHKICGVESHGMILAASDADEEHLSVVTTLSDMPDGLKVR